MPGNLSEGDAVGAIREDPLGSGSAMLKKVFGGLC
jgi:hypothetical protein